MFLISRYLKSIKTDVAAGRTLLSDALVSSLKMIRGMVGEERSTFFKRELLGYTDDESATYKGKSRPKTRQSVAAFVPAHRFIEGYWVTLTGSDWRQVPRTLDNRIESVFYPHGICELEEVLGRVTVSDSTWISVIFDESENRVFMSKTSDLKKLDDSCRKAFCKQIESFTKEIRLPRIPSSIAQLERAFGAEAETQRS